MRCAVGIDLSARRGLDLARLIDGTRLDALVHLPDVAATVAWLSAFAPNATIGIDAPQGPRRGLLACQATRAHIDPPPPDGRYTRHRVCDYHLARRGIGLYLSPSAGEPAPAWMAVGFALFAALAQRGYRTPRHRRDYAATLLEVYPYAAFVCLLGHIPPRKSTPEGRAARLAVLRAAGVDPLPATAGHDALDAIAAAVAADAFAAGRGGALGDADEGLLILPVPKERLAARYTLNGRSAATARRR